MGLVFLFWEAFLCCSFWGCVFGVFLLLLLVLVCNVCELVWFVVIGFGGGCCWCSPGSSILPGQLL